LLTITTLASGEDTVRPVPFVGGGCVRAGVAFLDGAEQVAHHPAEQAPHGRVVVYDEQSHPSPSCSLRMVGDRKVWDAVDWRADASATARIIAGARGLDYVARRAGGSSVLLPI